MDRHERRARRRMIAACAVLVMATVGSVDSGRARAATLPDGRAYELVTTGIDGALIQDGGISSVVAPSGDVLSFGTNDAPSSAPSSIAFNNWTATRGPTGWTDTILSPPLTLPEQGLGGTLVAGVSPDGLQSVVTSDQPLTPGAAPGTNEFLRSADGGYTLLTAPAAGGSASAGVPFTSEYDAASADFTHIFFTANAPLVAGDPLGAAGQSNLYQWAGGQLSLVNVMPDGTLGQTSASVPNTSTYGLAPVSTDGSDVLFMQGYGSPDLYLRENGAKTVDVSAPQGEPENPNSSAIADGVTSDGSQVLFTDDAQLTPTANTGRSGAGSDLYDYDTATGALTDLTPDHRHGDADGADVQSVVAAGSTGGFVYFTALGDLAPGATSGQTNLYVAHDGTITFVATGGGLGSDFETTADGTHLAFESTDSLTGYDNDDVSTGQPDAEVFEYDAATGALLCISCRASGAPPSGGSALSISSTPPVSDLSDDGAVVFFQSADAVIPQASNGLGNVFEYENGVVSLISAGNGPSAAVLIGATPSGDDVFFDTHDDLTPPQNAALAPAIYDARVGGGFPASAGASPSCAATASCQTPTLAPPPPVVSTVTFSGPQGRRARLVARVTIRRGSLRVLEVTLRVRVPGAGHLTVSGSDVHRVARAYARAQTATVNAALTARARRTLITHHRLRLVVRLRFTRRAGGTSTTTVHVTADQGSHR